MKKFLSFFIRYPVTVNVLLVSVLIYGWVSWNALNSTFFPVLPERIIVINAVYPGASPEEIEEGVVQKIEENLEGISGIERYTSTSSENAAVITIEVLRSSNSQMVLDDVEDAVNRIPSFPVGVEQINTFLQENLTLTITFGLKADSLNLRALKYEARKLEEELMALDGISKVDLLGFPEEEIEIAVSREKLRAYNLSVNEISNAIAQTNLDITGGTLKTPTEDLLIRARYKSYSPVDISNIVVRGNTGAGLVYVSDVATVRRQFADVPSTITLNGKTAVKVQVQNTNTEDILSTANAVKAFIKEYNAASPVMEAMVINNRADVLEQRKSLLIENGLIGVLLVLILLSLFLNGRVAFWVAAGLPFSFFGMFILASSFGITINVISLFGMIVVVGILVDDGIVISENIYHHYEKGKSRIRAAIDGTMEVLPAVITAVLTTMIAFASFWFIDGRAGDFFSEMATVVALTLAVSLVEALIILPAHIAHSKALSTAYQKNKLEKALDKGLSTVREKIYRPVLIAAIRNKFLTLSIVAALFIITLGAMFGKIVRISYFPFIDRDNFEVSLTLPAGTSEDITKNYLDYIRLTAQEVNDSLRPIMPDAKDIIQDVELNVGPQTHEGKLNIILLSSEIRGVSSTVAVNALRQLTGAIYEAENITFGSVGAFGKPVSVSLLSKNYEELRRVKEGLKNEMAQMSALRDVVDTDLEGVREMRIQLKPKAYLLGLSPGLIMQQVRQSFFGQEAQRLQIGEDELKVWVRYREKQRSSAYYLENLHIRTAEGGQYPLEELATIVKERGSLKIDHLNGKREIKVEAELVDPNGSAPDQIEEIRGQILPELLARNPSVSVKYEGQNREASLTIASAKKVMPLVLLLIILLITFTFRSLYQAITIFLLIPLSLVGVAWGHYVHQLPLSIFSFLGIIALIGVIVNDSLVLVSKFNGYLRDGLDFEDAIIQAGLSRFRAIVLTTATTIAGLAPLILEESMQAQFLVPMAIALAYGIAMATLLTLITLPVLLTVLNYIKVYGQWLWQGRRPAAEAVEPAIIQKKHDEDY